MNETKNEIPPSFTVRTLAIFVTLVCAYFGAWEATKRYAEDGGYQFSNLDARIYDIRSPLPLVVARSESKEMTWAEVTDRNHVQPPDKRRYYLWLFGPLFRLPFELDVETFPTNINMIIDE